METKNLKCELEKKKIGKKKELWQTDTSRKNERRSVHFDPYPSLSLYLSLSSCNLADIFTKKERNPPFEELKTNNPGEHLWLLLTKIPNTVD